MDFKKYIYNFQNLLLGVYIKHDLGSGGGLISFWLFWGRLNKFFTMDNSNNIYFIIKL